MAGEIKTQFIRVIDVFLYAPALLYMASKQKDKGLKRVLEVMGVTTLLYNGINLIYNMKKEQI